MTIVSKINYSISFLKISYWYVPLIYYHLGVKPLMSPTLKILSSLPRSSAVSFALNLYCQACDNVQCSVYRPIFKPPSQWNLWASFKQRIKVVNLHGSITASNSRRSYCMTIACKHFATAIWRCVSKDRLGWNYIIWGTLKEEKNLPPF